jgi:predicted RNA-binding Zn ribbon-like protein
MDFLNTLWIPVDVEVEGLADGQALLAWLVAAELIGTQVAEEVRTAASTGELDAVATQARGLREWFRVFVTAHRGKPLTRKAVSELGPLNHLLARDESFHQLVPQAKTGSKGSRPVELVVQRRWRSPEALLLPIAEALARLVADADFSDVKHCEGSGCMLQFLDTTRDRRRRWCSMAACGNRAKQAALRIRRAAGARS